MGFQGSVEQLPGAHKQIALSAPFLVLPVVGKGSVATDYVNPPTQPYISALVSCLQYIQKQTRRPGWLKFNSHYGFQHP